MLASIVGRVFEIELSVVRRCQYLWKAGLASQIQVSATCNMSLYSPGCIGVNACESIFRWGALVHHWAQCFAADHTHSSSMKVASSLLKSDGNMFRTCLAVRTAHRVSKHATTLIELFKLGLVDARCKNNVFSRCLLLDDAILLATL